jgi:hypothetical protein
LCKLEAMARSSSNIIRSSCCRGQWLHHNAARAYKGKHVLLLLLLLLPLWLFLCLLLQAVLAEYKLEA